VWIGARPRALDGGAADHPAHRALAEYRRQRPPARPLGAHGAGYVKSIFEMVGVSSRGELVAKLFGRHHAPPALDAGR
jgi:hypothetical protein